MLLDVNSTIAGLAASYMRPYRAGITLSAVDNAHLHWADYRDPQWGGYTPIGTRTNRLLRINIIGGKLHYVSCTGSKSLRRILRQKVLLRLLQSVLDQYALPDVDFVVSISDRPTVPRHAIPPGTTPPPVFAYATTPAHHSVPFPTVSFDPLRWPALHARIGSQPTLATRTPKALWRGTCNSLCDMMRGRRCALPKDAELLPRQQLLKAAAQCPASCDVGVTATHKNCAGFPPRAPKTMMQHARYALLVHVDGNGFSGRLDELLTLGGAILKQDSPFSAYYYPLLQRGVHFQPLARNLSDLCHASSSLLAAFGPSSGISNGLAAKLGEAAMAFASRYLSPEAVARYVLILLREYATLQRFVPRVHPDAVSWRDQTPGTGNRAGNIRQHRARTRATSMGASAEGCSDDRCCQRHPKACARRAHT